MKNLIYGLFVLLAYSLILSACANRVSPTGGEKDVKAPVILAASPANEQTQFDATEIVMQFDEFIDLQDPQNQILISPAMKERPEFKKKGKKLVIRFKEELRPNTTYTINFGESIVDITEKNSLGNFEYTFSTGEVLDSLWINGRVVNAADNAPSEKVLVGIYDTSSDTLFRSTPPLYIARTDKDGRFKMNNLPSGTYQLVALDDQNNNLFYDIPTEPIAFYPDYIKIDTSKAPLYALRLFSEGKEKIKLMERNNREFGRIELIYSSNSDSLAVEVLESPIPEKDLLIYNTSKNDTVDVWYRNHYPKSLQLVVNDYAGYQDTINFKKLADSSSLSKVKFISNMRGGRGTSAIHLKKPVYIEFNHPIQTVKESLINLLEDSVALDIAPIIKRPSNNPRKLVFNHAWKAETNYQLLIPDSTVFDFFGKYNEAIDITFKTTPRDQYGNLLVKLVEIDSSQQYLLKIIDARKNVTFFDVMEGSQKELTYLETGTYTIFVIKDENKNGEWDTGNYDEKLQAERVFNARNTIQVKANWDSEVEVKVSDD